MTSLCPAAIWQINVFIYAGLLLGTLDVYLGLTWALWWQQCFSAMTLLLGCQGDICPVIPTKPVIFFIGTSDVSL